MHIGIHLFKSNLFLPIIMTVANQLGCDCLLSPVREDDVFTIMCTGLIVETTIATIL